MSAHPHQHSAKMYGSSVYHTHIKAHSNSWYLRTGEVHNFFCKCGCVDQYRKGVPSLEHHPSHRCSSCGNGYYIDVVVFRHSKQVKIFKTFHWDVEYAHAKNYWDVTYTVKYPKFDCKQQMIVMYKEELMYADMGTSGSVIHRLEGADLLEKSVFNGRKRPVKIRVLMERRIIKDLLQFAESTKQKTVKWLKGIPEYQQLPSPDEKVRIIVLFLKYNFKDFNFYYWRGVSRGWSTYSDDKRLDRLHTCFNPARSLEVVLGRIYDNRRERSVKRAFFKAYQEVIEQKAYDPLPDMIFSRTIDDPNLLVRLIKIPPKIKHRMFEQLDAEHIETLFSILRFWFDDKQIVRLFESITLQQIEEGIVRDLLWMLRNEEVIGQLQRDFPKPAANMNAVHEAFISARHQIQTGESPDTQFEYRDYAYKAETTVKELRFALPRSVKQLNLWSNRLHNCMFSYARAIKQQQTLVYGVFIEDALLYAIEVREVKIVQKLGKYNKRIGEEHSAVISIWEAEFWSSMNRMEKS